MYTPKAAVRRVRSTLFLISISLLSFLGAFVPVAIPIALATKDPLGSTNLQTMAATQNEGFPKRAPVVPNRKSHAISAGNASMAWVLPPGTPSAYRTVGMDFSPYVDGQDPNSGTIISEDQLRARMQIIANNTTGVRSFGCSHGLEKTGMVAHSLGLNAAVGAWLGRDPLANDQEISNLVSAANAGQVDLAIVGSEVLLRGDLSESQLIGYMNQVRQQIPANIPVTTADVYGELLEHPAVIANSDVVLPNYYPYWEGVSVDIAIATLHRQHQQVVAASPGKSVIVSETGWPSAGNTICNAVPSPANASFYFLNFVSWARANSVSYFYFDALDEAWKANHGEGPQGAHWGVWDKDGVLKPGMQAVFDGQTIPDNWTNAGIPGGPGSPSIEFSSVPPYGSNNNLFGQVLHVNTDDYRVAVYIYVGGWWTKPTFANPLTNIGLTGVWECDITTGGSDPNATQIVAFLVPATFSPPLMSGGQTLPPSLDQNSVARTEIARSSTSLYIQGRVTDSNGQELSCVTISLTGSQTATTHTISNGVYSFINLQPGGNYTVTPSHPSYTFSPSSLTFNNLGSNQTGDFVASPSTSTITLSASPAAGGTVSGAGTFATGSSRTVTATANSGYTFANWTENGSVVSLSTSYTFTLNADRALVANFTVNPVTHTLTVASSNPASGVSITVSPNDNNGQGNGVTQFTRVYNNNIGVTLTAPSTAGGNNFSRWQRDGTDFSFNQTTAVTMDANHTMTAVYVTPPPPIRTLTIASSNPSSGVSITVSPLDNNGQGSGATQFTRVYNNNTVVMLTAPATAAGNNFQKWQRDGSDVATSPTTNVTMDANHTMTAVYTTPSQGTCANPYSLTLGQAFNGNTAGGQSSFGSYNCVGWNESGPERVHTITLGSAGTLTATLSNLAGIDLDIFILSSCNASSCLAFGDNAAGANIGPGTYYILVDGFEGAIGGYTLTVNVSGSSHTATVGLYFPGNGGFYLRNSNTTGGADVTFSYGPAGQGWIPIVGDWDGNGTDTIGLYNPANGTFYLRNSNSIGFADITFSYGPPGQNWIPLTGDWNGDGVDTVGLYNPANGVFYLRNSNSVGVADITFSYGPVGQGWIPLVGDWNGDGVDTVGLYNPSNSAFYLRNSNSVGNADLVVTFGPSGSGWTPIEGDWNGDGTDTIGLYNPSIGGFYLRNSNSFGGADVVLTYGPANAGWKPIVGDWDGL
jgi:exo-beta-1,3-glucanase (GH17 family)